MELIDQIKAHFVEEMRALKEAEADFEAAMQLHDRADHDEARIDALRQARECLRRSRHHASCVIQDVGFIASAQHDGPGIPSALGATTEIGEKVRARIDARDAQLASLEAKVTRRSEN